jgi:hypothetical protein
MRRRTFVTFWSESSHALSAPSALFGISGQRRGMFIHECLDRPLQYVWHLDQPPQGRGACSLFRRVITQTDRLAARLLFIVIIGHISNLASLRLPVSLAASSIFSPLNFAASEMP